MAIASMMKLLSPLLSTSIAIKGLKKINPQVGSFITTALASGYTADQALGFLRSKLETPADQSEQARLQQKTADQTGRPDELAALQSRRQEERPLSAATSAASLGTGLVVPALMSKLGAASPKGIDVDKTIEDADPAQDVSSGQATESMGAAGFIAQHPELGKYLDEQISKGASPEAAATSAKRKRSFKSIIANIESKIGQPFPAIVAQLFQAPQQSQEQQAQEQPSGAMGSLMQALQELKRLRGG